MIGLVYTYLQIVYKKYACAMNRINKIMKYTTIYVK
jgi:hypothetical protein